MLVCWQFATSVSHQITNLFDKFILCFSLVLYRYFLFGWRSIWIHIGPPPLLFLLRVFWFFSFFSQACNYKHFSYLPFQLPSILFCLVTLTSPLAFIILTYLWPTSFLPPCGFCKLAHTSCDFGISPWASPFCPLLCHLHPPAPVVCLFTQEVSPSFCCKWPLIGNRPLQFSPASSSIQPAVGSLFFCSTPLRLKCYSTIA